MRNVGNRLFAYAVATVAIASVAQPARAYVGPLLTCAPTVGTLAPVTFKPGLDCDEEIHRFDTSVMLDGCATGPANWDWWAYGRYGSRISQFNADRVTKASVSLKGSMFGSCNFYDSEPWGSPGVAAPSASGKLRLYDANGFRIFGGSGEFFARIVDDFDFFDPAYIVLGIMTKGFGAGAKINLRLQYDTGNPYNAEVLGCSISGIDPCPVEAPQITVHLMTSYLSYLEVYFGGEGTCTGTGTPLKCCTGEGTGSTCQGL
ncbi:hypothetical protein L6Q96_15275 [Candidatus Binatia bacterium]|nr:hypothetical protein [Candidatus Binatia bacterium]